MAAELLPATEVCGRDKSMAHHSNANTARHGATWYGTTRHGTTRHGMHSIAQEARNGTLASSCEPACDEHTQARSPGNVFSRCGGVGASGASKHAGSNGGRAEQANTQAATAGEPGE